MLCMGRIWCVVALVLVGLVPTTTLAQRNAGKIAEARRAFEAGTSAYERGAFPKALYHFEKAYKLTGSPDLLYNIATVSDRMRNDEKALRAYEGYLKARPKSPDRAHVKARIKVLRASIAAKAEAKIRAQEEAARRAALAEQRVKEERPLTKKVPPGAGPWALMGGSAAVAATGAVMVVLGRRDIKKVEGLPPGSIWEQHKSLRDKGERRAKVGVALLGVGAAGIIGGALWQATGWKEEKVTEVGLSPTGVWLRGQF